MHVYIFTERLYQAEHIETQVLELEQYPRGTPGSIYGGVAPQQQQHPDTYWSVTWNGYSGDTSTQKHKSTATCRKRPAGEDRPGWAVPRLLHLIHPCRTPTPIDRDQRGISTTDRLYHIYWSP